MDAWRNALHGVATAATKTMEGLKPHVKNHLEQARGSLQGVAEAAAKTADNLQPHVNKHLHQAQDSFASLAAATAKTAEDLRPHIERHRGFAQGTINGIVTAAAKAATDFEPQTDRYRGYAQETINGVVLAAAKATEELQPHVKNHLEQAKESLEDTAAACGKSLKRIEWERLPEAAKEHIKNNPRITAVQISLSLVTLCPSLVATPALMLLGFGSLGPIAVSGASVFQSVFGTPIGFRLLQSAAMGGWGASIVGGVVSAGSLVANSVVGLVCKKKLDEEKERQHDAQKD